MSTQLQIQQNRERIRLKLLAEKERKEEALKEKAEEERNDKTEKQEAKKEFENRNDLASKIAEEIKGIITSEMAGIVKGIKELNISSPEIPEIKIPEITLPKIELPEITIPEIIIPEIKIPDIKLPKIFIPEIKTPIIPEIKIPEIKTEELIEAIREEIKEVFKAPLKVISIDEDGKLNEGNYVPGGGTHKWLRNIEGDDINPATEDKQDTQITSEADKLFDYKLSGIDDTTSTVYLGYLNKDGAWYIAKYLSTGVTYAKGSSGYNWSNRASESYGEFNDIF